jgi:ubiquinone/menaquinone biosynthesis C-methylase UbiE
MYISIMMSHSRQESVLAMESNHASYQLFAGDYNDYFLYPSERVLLEHFRSGWGTLKVLDIGIGTGPTTFTLSAICRQYTGIDYSSEMVKACRSRLP